ncbi:MAG: hypothetical protein ACYCUV_16225 [Phycisphaerae bacterium]
MADPQASLPDLTQSKGFHWRGYRWAVCLGLFLITTINYMDRVMMSLLEPRLLTQLHFCRWNMDILPPFSARCTRSATPCAAGLWMRSACGLASR